MSEIITIAGDGAQIILTLHGYERERTSDLSDANWLDCHLNFRIGEITGSIDLTIESHDLKGFAEQLDRLIQGDIIEAELKPVEEAVLCTINMTTFGHALVSGVIKTHGSVKAELLFSFESDQSFLRQTSIELNAAVEKFPVKTQ